MCCGNHKTVKVLDGSPAQTPLVDSANHLIRPAEPCVLCAEKHLYTAWALGREFPYMPVNRATIVGELCLCQWHLVTFDLPLAQKVRDMRHLIQKRKEGDIKWEAPILEMDSLVRRLG